MGKEEVIKKTVKIGDEEKVVEILKPTPRIDAEANMHASKVFSKLIKQKNEDGSLSFILRAQLDEFLKEIGVYTDQDIKDMGVYAEKVKELEDVLMKGGKKKSEGKDIAIKLRTYRWALLNLLGKRMDYDKNTVEHYAENARMDYLVTRCICFEGGYPVFSSVDDYESDAAMQDVLAEPIRELASLVSTFDPDYEHKLVENKFLKKYGFCDDKYNLVDSQGRRVDDKGRLVNEDGMLINDSGELVDEAGKVLVNEIGEFLDDDEVEEVEVVIPAPEDFKLEEPVVEELKEEVKEEATEVVAAVVDSSVQTPEPPAE
jgi:hypothetical protein